MLVELRLRFGLLSGLIFVTEANDTGPVPSVAFDACGFDCYHVAPVRSSVPLLQLLTRGIAPQFRHQTRRCLLRAQGEFLVGESMNGIAAAMWKSCTGWGSGPAHTQQRAPIKFLMGESHHFIRAPSSFFALAPGISSRVPSWVERIQGSCTTGLITVTICHLFLIHRVLLMLCRFSMMRSRCAEKCCSMLILPGVSQDNGGRVERFSTSPPLVRADDHASHW